MRRFVNWKFISLFTLCVITFVPYFAFLFSKIAFSDFDVEQPVKILRFDECSSLLGVPCSKALLFNVPGLKVGEGFVLGLTTIKPRIRCLGGGKDIVVDSVSSFGSTLVFQNEINECRQGVMAYYRDDLDSSSGSWIVPFLVKGNIKHLNRVGRSFDFYRSELRSIIAGIVPFQVVLLYFMLMLLGGGISFQYLYAFITVSIMAVVNGGLLEKLFFLRSDFFIPEVKEYLAFLLITLFFVESVQKNSRVRHFLYCVTFSAVLELVVSLFAVPKNIIWEFIICAWGVLAVITRFSFLTSTFFILNCFYLLSVFTPFNVFPQYAGTLFFMVYFLGFQIEQVRLRLLNWRINQVSRKVVSIHQVHALIKMISRVHKVGRISLSLVKNESFEHWIFTSESIKPKKLSDTKATANVVLKVYASGRPIVHLDASRDLGEKISNKEKIYRSKFFSSFPIKFNGDIWGVLSFTDYKNTILHDDVVDSLGNVFLECTEIVAKTLSQVTNKFASEIEDVFTSFFDVEEKGINSILQRTLESLYLTYGISGYFSEISKDNLIKLQIASGTLLPLMKDINRSSFKVSSSNEFGPIALAFKDIEPIILQNWRPLSDKISDAAKDVYRETKANSIMTVPIVLRIGKSAFRFLLWLQTNEDRTFNGDFYRTGKMIQNRLTNALNKQFQALAGDTILSLADSEAIQNVVFGNETIIRENGELLMVDLGRSTLISGLLGVDKYKEAVDFYSKETSEALKKLNYRLQMVIGDALLFTRPESETSLSRRSLASAILESESKVKDYFKRTGVDVYGHDEPSIRACRISGDISRDLVKGKGGGWAIVGSTISEVHKIEAAAKNFREGYFFELESSIKQDDLEFLLTNLEPFPGSGKLIYLSYKQKKIIAA